MAPWVTDTKSQRRLTTAILLLVIAAIALVFFLVLTERSFEIGPDHVRVQRTEDLRGDLNAVRDDLTKELQILNRELMLTTKENIALRDSISGLIYEKQQLLNAAEGMLAALNAADKLPSAQADSLLAETERFLSFRRNPSLEAWNPHAEVTDELGRKLYAQRNRINELEDELGLAKLELAQTDSDSTRMEQATLKLNQRINDLGSQLAAAARHAEVLVDSIQGLNIQKGVVKLELDSLRSVVTKWRKINLEQEVFRPKPLALKPNDKGHFQAKKFKGLYVRFKFSHNDSRRSDPVTFKVVYTTPSGTTSTIPRTLGNYQPGIWIEDAPEDHRHKWAPGEYKASIYAEGDAGWGSKPIQELTFWAY